MTERPGQVIRHTGDASKIRQHFEWVPLVDWRSGLTRTIEWYQTNSCFWEKQLWLRRVPLNFSAGITEYH